MTIKLANNASGLLATAINASDTGIVLRSGDGGEFPALGAGDYFYATLTSTQGTQEIVKVTARVGDTMTVVRAQEGTTANGFAVDTRFELRVTAASVDDRVDEAESEAIAYADGLDTALRTDLAASSGSSLVGYTQGSGSAVATTVQAKLRETVSVKDFGAVGDGVTDDTAAIQAAINTGVKAIVPPGVYRITSALVINSNQHLHIASGARLNKNEGTIEPVVRIIRNNAFLTGDGYNSIIRNDDVTGFPSDPSKEGVVNIGGRTLTESVNINWSRVSNLQIRGSSTRWSNYNSSGGADTAIDLDIGVKMVNGTAFNSGGSDSLYNTLVDNIFFLYLGIGIDLEPIVQGNSFSMLHYFRCTRYGIQMKGCNENSLNQTFFHSCPGIVYVRLRRGYSPAEVAALGFATYTAGETGCAENSFTNLMGEPGPDGPGGRFSRVYNFDGGVQRTYLQGNQNTGHANTDNSVPNSNIVILENNMTLGLLRANRAEISGPVNSDSLTATNKDGSLVIRQGHQTSHSYRATLDSANKIRFTFDGAPSRSYGFLIKAKATWLASSSFNNHGFLVAAVNVQTPSASSVNSSVGGLFENNFSASNVNVTAVGSGDNFYIDIANPTGDNNVIVTVFIESLTIEDTNQITDVEII